MSLRYFRQELLPETIRSISMQVLVLYSTARDKKRFFANLAGLFPPQSQSRQLESTINWLILVSNGRLSTIFEWKSETELIPDSKVLSHTILQIECMRERKIIRNDFQFVWCSVRTYVCREVAGSDGMQASQVLDLTKNKFCFSTSPHFNRSFSSLAPRHGTSPCSSMNQYSCTLHVGCLELCY